MCRLRYIAMRDYQESVTTGQLDAGQSDPKVPLCFAGDMKINGEQKISIYTIIYINLFHLMINPWEFTGYTFTVMILGGDENI